VHADRAERTVVACESVDGEPGCPAEEPVSGRSCYAGVPNRGVGRAAHERDEPFGIVGVGGCFRVEGGERERPSPSSRRAASRSRTLASQTE
jgi:hypothetical protein